MTHLKNSWKSKNTHDGEKELISFDDMKTLVSALVNKKINGAKGVLSCLNKLDELHKSITPDTIGPDIYDKIHAMDCTCQSTCNMIHGDRLDGALFEGVVVQKIIEIKKSAFNAEVQKIKNIYRDIFQASNTLEQTQDCELRGGVEKILFENIADFESSVNQILGYELITPELSEYFKSMKEKVNTCKKTES